MYWACVSRILYIFQTDKQQLRQAQYRSQSEPKCINFNIKLQTFLGGDNPNPRSGRGQPLQHSRPRNPSCLRRFRRPRSRLSTIRRATFVDKTFRGGYGSEIAFWWVMMAYHKLCVMCNIHHDLLHGVDCLLSLSFRHHLWHHQTHLACQFLFSDFAKNDG